MPHAARVGDMQTCPEKPDQHTPGAAGPIVSGTSTVLIDFMPAARVGDEAISDAKVTEITKGSGTVLIGGKPAARVGDATENGGTIAVGSPTVVIGD